MLKLVNEKEQRVAYLIASLKRCRLSSNLIWENDDRTRFFTGLPSFPVFIELYTFLEVKASRRTYWSSKESELQRRSRHKLSLLDEFFIVLVRLRHGVSAEFLAALCDIHETTFGRMFRTWIRFLALELSALFPYPPKELIEKWMPLQFKRYPNTRCIIDCTDFFIERPSSMNA